MARTFTLLPRALAMFVAVLLAVAVRADDADMPTVRPVTSAYMLQAGTAHLADTYLTPLKYSGSRWSLAYERSQAMRFDPERWIMQLGAGLSMELTQNPVKNSDMASAQIEASWRMLRRWSLPLGVTAGVGPATSIGLGVLYLSRNGNNPAQAKAAWTIDAAGYASWAGRLWRVPVTLRYQATLPVVGAFFAPDYGQLYYQIYMGDRSHLAHMAHWGSYFRLDNLVTADLHFGATTLRLGYRGQVFSSKINGIVARDISHALVVGITLDWIALRPGKSMPAANIIPAYR